jgi:formylglycine-generating enzyme required for sulfatase activity
VTDRVVIPASATVTSFAIDRHPVTVARFEAFVSAGGYETKRYWTDDGWTWRQAESVAKPRFWDDPAWAAYLVPTHPVVGVSFHEARAFARFEEALLPTEAQWERAARGDDGRAYPWGPEWIEGACGGRGIGPRGTVPVGSYPSGASPFGVEDLVGCVWQWCTDEHPNPDGGVARATRGGAWNTLRWSLTTTACNPYPAGARFSNLGFRTVAT